MSDWPENTDDPAACENCGYNPNDEDEREERAFNRGRSCANNNWTEALRQAVNAECDCGGGSPSDGCAACRIWHRLKGHTQPAAAALLALQAREEGADE